MKKITIILITIELLSLRFVHAQGTTYLSNLGQTPTGSVSIGSNSMYDALFFTGANTDGYILNSVQLGIADASGNPSGFMVMIYNSHLSGISPASSLGTLNGSNNPSTAGIYTYTDNSNIILSPNTDYFIVLSAGTIVANGAYEWNLTTPNSYSSSGGWSASGSPQFAITATAIPEPSSLALFSLSSLLFIRHRRKAKAD